MLNNKIELSIVIPSLNGLNHLQDFLLKNLELIDTTLKNNNNYQNIEMIVVNDNSTDDTLKYLEKTKKDFDFLHFDTNPKQGICSARNFGVSLSILHKNNMENSLKYLLFIDNDVLLEKDFFDYATKYLEKNVFCISCNGVNYFTKEIQDGAKLTDFKRGFFRFTKNIYIDQLSNFDKLSIPSYGAQGAYFFINFKDFLELKGFDENLDPYVLEESDFIYRGLKRGKESIFAKDVTGFHKVGGTIKSKTSQKTKILSKRNRIYITWKNLHNKSLFIQHLFFLLLSLFSPIGFKGFWQSLGMLKKALVLNKEEKLHIKVDDLEILNQSKKFENKFNNK